MLRSQLFPCSGHSVASRGLVTGGATKGGKKSKYHSLGDTAGTRTGQCLRFLSLFFCPWAVLTPSKAHGELLALISPDAQLARAHRDGEKREMQFPRNKKPRVLLEALPARWCRAVFSCTGRSMQLLGRDKGQKKNAPRSELSILITSLGGGRALGEMLKHTHLEQRGD